MHAPRIPTLPGSIPSRGPDDSWPAIVERLADHVVDRSLVAACLMHTARHLLRQAVEFHANPLFRDSPVILALRHAMGVHQFNALFGRELGPAGPVRYGGFKVGLCRCPFAAPDPMRSCLFACIDGPRERRAVLAFAYVPPAPYLARDLDSLEAELTALAPALPA